MAGQQEVGLEEDPAAAAMRAAQLAQACGVDAAETEAPAGMPPAKANSLSVHCERPTQEHQTAEAESTAPGGLEIDNISDAEEVRVRGGRVARGGVTPRGCGAVWGSMWLC
jgi:hypothetical protein